MDAYVIGFIAISAISLLIGVMAIIFLSFDGEQKTDGRIRYTHVRHLNTNTIETVNLSGETEVWERSA